MIKPEVIGTIVTDSDQTHYTTLLIRKVSGTSKNSGFLEETNLAS